MHAAQNFNRHEVVGRQVEPSKAREGDVFDVLQDGALVVV